MIKPRFKLNKISPSKVRLHFQPTLFCEKRISLGNHSNWAKIQSNTVITDLQTNTIYEICLRCRMKLTDPSGDQYCQQIKLTWKIPDIIGYYLELNKKIFLAIGLVSFDLILSIIICWIYL